MTEQKKFREDVARRLEEFLKDAHQFKLGELPTEQPHAGTVALSKQANEDLPAAIQSFHQVDLAAIAKIVNVEGIEDLQTAVSKTLASGHRVFLCGCGATGRLSITLERIWRKLNPHSDAIVSFMAGGDLALVHSIENFEDRPHYGARQLRELGFGVNDLLISCTEGGETPFVIGATEEASEISRQPPWFLYCNPDASLKNIERSQNVITNPKIRKINLYCGNMALTGSTRLQATTVLQLATGAALFGANRTHAREMLAEFFTIVQGQSFQFLVPLIEEESRVYKEGGVVHYHADEYAISVFTDTTERSPTFSLRSFENQRLEKPVPSLSYVHIPGADQWKDAWTELLGHFPRTLEWDEVAEIAGLQRLKGFDFSDAGLKKRVALVDGMPVADFWVRSSGNKMEMQLNHLQASLTKPNHLLFEHLLLKLALNMHSTLVMGRMGRYHDNVMTYVKPSNKKLIDRAIRYVQQLLKNHHVAYNPSYEELAKMVFEEAEVMGPNDPIVMRVFDRISK